MSVPTGKRNTSTMEFLANARARQLFTLRHTKSWPTRWRQDVSSPLCQDARYIYIELKAGNNISYPKNAHEAQMRRDHFLNARGRLDGMIAQIEVACELLEVNDKVRHSWSALAAQEIALINGVLDSDSKRFRF